MEEEVSIAEQLPPAIVMTLKQKKENSDNLKSVSQRRDEIMRQFLVKKNVRDQVKSICQDLDNSERLSKK